MCGHENNNKNQQMERFLPYRAIIDLSLVYAVYGAARLYSFFSEKSFRRYLTALRKKIRKDWNNNPNIEKLDVKCENTIPVKSVDEGIQFFVKVISSAKFAKAKPTTPPAKGTTDKYDPFSPEHRGKLFIEDLSATHCLLYNKFPLVPFHVIIVTKNFEEQMSPASPADFEAALTVMKSLDCFVFFNGGPDAGASQRHKHLQAIPYGSFPNQTIPLDAIIERNGREDEASKDEEVEYTSVPPFNFKHVLCKFHPRITFNLTPGSLQRKSRQLYDVYMECLRRLGNTDLKLAYNFVLTKNWMFVVLRKCEVALGMVKINAVGFTGSFAVRSDEEYEFIRSQDPIKILQSVTYPL